MADALETTAPAQTAVVAAPPAAAHAMPIPIRNMSRLPLLRQMGLLLGIAGSVALGVAVVFWSQTPSYRLLYNELADRELSQVIESLEQANIPYKLDGASGGVLVPDKQLYDARLKLAAQGLPQSAKQGFDSIAEGSSFGTSQFMENARYQRALEGEVVRTISAIRSVESARVHLAIPKQSLFIRAQQRPSASVLVNLYAGRRLDRGQVAAIVHLVASSIPDLDPERVTVVDQKGRLLTSKDDKDSGLNTSQFVYAQGIEEAYIKRVEDLLIPIVGLDGVKAKVAVDMDFTITEQTQESYKPANNPVRSEEVVREETIATGLVSAAGVPGALSNQPPAAGVAPEVATATPANPAQAISPPEIPKNTSSRTTRSYEVDRTISRTRNVPGRIRRISVAVVVDHKQSKGSNGQITSTPRTEEEMERVTALVKEAIGFNADRGDSVQVVNTPFTPAPELEPMPEEAWWQQSWIWDIGKQVLGVLFVLYLVFGVLRPAMRNLSSKSASSGAGELQVVTTADGTLAYATNAEGAPMLSSPQSNYDAQLAAAKGLVSEDPKRVAQVVKTWVASDA